MSEEDYKSGIEEYQDVFVEERINPMNTKA